ncbi:hypothetical protein AFLA70_57g003811 [Aspergillus flavus AF70]|nr:hypothetical protein AFLA70_57g003811 [Aspergillus flavus AF70]
MVGQKNDTFESQTDLSFTALMAHILATSRHRRDVASQPRRMAVEYTHTRGVVHGDLHLGNALLRLPAALDRLSIKELYHRYGMPTTEPVVRLDSRPLQPNVPSTAILPMWLGKPCEELSASEVQLLLTDFGEAYSPSTENRCEIRTPLAFAPPEARFEPERSLSFSSDIGQLHVLYG